jgi:hypothetical protein
MVLSGQFYKVKITTNSGLVVEKTIFGDSPENASENTYKAFSYLVIKSIEVSDYA